MLYIIFFKPYNDVAVLWLLPSAWTYKSDQTLQAASTASTGCQLLARRHVVPLKQLQMK